MIRSALSAAISAILLFGPLKLPGADKAPAVLNGIDVLRQRNFDLLSGKRVGLVTNHTGFAADGTSTIDLFFKAKAFRLVALFSPEHGIRGMSDEKVSSSVDEATGLPVYSLYGKSLRPTPDMLKDLDILVFDVQDVGARFYTYITTMAYCMEEAAKADIPFIVLDRPNPIGGVRVEGPMLDADKTSFTGYMPLPVRHGMTVGELARYFNTENRIGARLQVVPMQGWRRSFYFWDTGQIWANLSPNMRSILAALLYPGVCLLERTNISVGRGTDRPFEIIGAPWIEPRRFVQALKSARVPGIQYSPVYFTPDASKYKGVRCGGAGLLITDSDRLNSVLLGMTLASVLNKLYPEQFKIDNIIELLGNESATKMLKAGQSPVKVLRSDSSNLRKFLARRQKALIYD
ncbi:MAG TPA: DUF1343 domain-containing protein [Acidobacteriota bacterium]|nr:DUF1343 domain-containing protein [Acidobacteriota bacterium]